MPTDNQNSVFCGAIACYNTYIYISDEWAQLGVGPLVVPLLELLLDRFLVGHAADHPDALATVPHGLVQLVTVSLELLRDLGLRLLVDGLFVLPPGFLQPLLCLQHTQTYTRHACAI